MPKRLSPILASKGVRYHLFDTMTECTDVLICGGGPVGLLTGLALVRMGISTVVIGELQRRIRLPTYDLR